MPRTLVICCDGTWNTAGDDTNVRRLYDALATTPTQVPQYFSGVGTHGNPLARLLGGATGAGLSESIRVAYRWLADHWAPGDRLVLVGFSRGAFTVRSLVGMLTRCGLVRFPDGASDAARDRLVRHVYDDGYRRRRPLPDVATQPDFGPDDTAPIDFLGVWDTVGALGVPRTFGLLSTLFGGDVRFHDTSLDDDVRHARQALALDERRGPYVPSVWATPTEGAHASFAQLWFPGGHGDVGGGTPERALSDGALRWMVEEMTSTVGLTWATDLRGPAGDPCLPRDDEPTGVWRYLSPRPRTAPHVIDGAPDVHPTAVARRACPLTPPYRPGVVPDVGTPRTFPVDAAEPWDETGLYLPVGRYRFRATGSWRDHGAAVPVTGARRWPVRSWPGWALGTVLDGVRRATRALTSRRADVIGSRRVLEARWMELVLAVANDVLHTDGTLDEGTTAGIGPDGTVEVDVPRPGYLYAFADDAWTGYGSNGGSVEVTCERLG